MADLLEPEVARCGEGAMKRTNRVAWGLAVGLGGVLLLAVPLGARLYYGVVGLSISTTGVDIAFSGDAPAYPGLCRNGVVIPPSDGPPVLACGPGGSRITQVYREGDVVKVVSHCLIFFPWRRW
jgi:hypothetical protein